MRRGSRPVGVLHHSGGLRRVVGLFPFALWLCCCAKGEAETVLSPCILILNVARNNDVGRHTEDSNGGLAMGELGFVLVVPAPHGEEAHFTILCQDCSEGGSRQELRATNVQADDGGGGAQHSADHRLRKGVDGGGVCVGGGDHNDAVGLFIHCKVDEVKRPGESATQGCSQIASGVREGR